MQIRDREVEICLMVFAPASLGLALAGSRCYALVFKETADV